MENIHVAKLEASLLNAVKQNVAIQVSAVMGAHVHDDHGFFALWFFNDRRFFYNRFWLNVLNGRGLWRRLRLSVLNRLLLNGLLYGLLHRLWRGLQYRLLHRRLNRLLMYGLLRLAHRLFNRLWSRLRTRLCRSIRRLILVLRRARCIMLPMTRDGRSIDPMNANFTHAVVAIVDVVFNAIVVTS